MSEVIGLGVDLCAVERIEKALDRAHFAQRVYTEAERDYLAGKGVGRAQSAAAIFAAKEAVAKALGTGFSGGIMPEQIEVTHDARGAPGIRLSGAAHTRFEKMGGRRVLLSLTHEGGLAQATALVVGVGQPEQGR